MMERVGAICKEAALAVEIAQKAKDGLAKAQLWSCTKGKVKSDTWFEGWVQFLDLLPRALARASEAKVLRLAALAEAAQQEEAARQQMQMQKQRPPPLAERNGFPAPLGE